MVVLSQYYFLSVYLVTFVNNRSSSYSLVNSIITNMAIFSKSFRVELRMTTIILLFKNHPYKTFVS